MLIPYLLESWQSSIQGLATIFVNLAVSTANRAKALIHTYTSCRVLRTSPTHYDHTCTGGTSNAAGTGPSSSTGALEVLFLTQSCLMLPFLVWSSGRLRPWMPSSAFSWRDRGRHWHIAFHDLVQVCLLTHRHLRICT